MKLQSLGVEEEFDLMVGYQIAIESMSVIVENDERDMHKYSLFSIKKPFPSYNEYMNGDDFDESVLLQTSNSIDYLVSIQEQRRKTGLTLEH